MLSGGLVAELLAERGEDEAALRWFNRAIGAGRGRSGRDR
jgi:hypothetical protein